MIAAVNKKPPKTRLSTPILVDKPCLGAATYRQKCEAGFLIVLSEPFFALMSPNQLESKICTNRVPCACNEDDWLYSNKVTKPRLLPPPNTALGAKRGELNADFSREMEKLLNDGKIVKLVEDLIVTNIPHAQQMLQEVIETSSSDIVADFGDVHMVDSQGIALIIQTCLTLNREQRRFTIVHARPEIVRLLKTMRLDRHLVIA